MVGSFTRSPAAHFLPCTPFLTGRGPVTPALTERQTSGLQKGWGNGFRFWEVGEECWAGIQGGGRDQMF